MNEEVEEEKALAAETTGASGSFHPPWFGYPLSGCSPAEPDSVSPEYRSWGAGSKPTSFSGEATTPVTGICGAH